MQRDQDNEESAQTLDGIEELTSTRWSCWRALCGRRVGGAGALVERESETALLDREDAVDSTGGAAACCGDLESSFGELPDEVLMNILSRLGARSLALGAAPVCRRWAELAARGAVWYQLFLWHAHYGALVAHPCLQSLAEAHTDTLEPEELPEPWATFWAGKSWREIYKDEYYLQFDASPSSPGRQDDSFDDLLKLVVVGPGNAGKSTLLDRFVDGTYGGGFNNHGVKSATLGVEFYGMLVGIRGRRIKLQLWDTAGPERYLPVTTSYYRDARGILLCFDLTYSDSLEHLRSSYVPGVQRGAPPGAAVLLVGMKADQEECRQVSVAEVNELAAWVEDQLGVRPGTWSAAP